MAKKEVYYIRVSRKGKTGRREETFVPVHGYTMTVVSPYASFDIGVTNEDQDGKKKAHWTASIIPYGVRLASEPTKAGVIAKVTEDRELCLGLKCAIPMLEQEWQKSGKRIYEKAKGAEV